MARRLGASVRSRPPRCAGEVPLAKGSQGAPSQREAAAAQPSTAPSPKGPQIGNGQRRARADPTTTSGRPLGGGGAPPDAWARPRAPPGEAGEDASGIDKVANGPRRDDAVAAGWLQLLFHSPSWANGPPLTRPAQDLCAVPVPPLAGVERVATSLAGERMAHGCLPSGPTADWPPTAERSV